MTTGISENDLKKNVNLFCDDTYTTTLAGSTEATLTIPATKSVGSIGIATNEWLAEFSYSDGAVVWVANNATAAVPAGATLAASTSELNPRYKRVKAGDIISVISAGTPSLSIALYSIQG